MTTETTLENFCTYWSVRLRTCDEKTNKEFIAWMRANETKVRELSNFIFNQEGCTSVHQQSWYKNACGIERYRDQNDKDIS